MVMPFLPVQPYLFKIKARVMAFRRRKFKRKFARRSTRFRRFRRRRMPFRRSMRAKLEIKVDDTVTSSLTPDSGAATVLRMHILTQGVGANQRIGNQVTIRTTNVRWSLFVHASLANQTAICRVAVFLDKQTVPSGLPSAGDVYVNPTDPQSFRDQFSAGRFRQLFSKTFILNKGGAGQPCKLIAWSHTFVGGLRTKYGTATANSMSKNLVFMIIQSDAPASTPTTLNVLERVVFTDA